MPIDRIESQAVEEREPAAVEPLHARRQVAGDGAAATVGRGLGRPGGRIGPGEEIKRLDRLGENAHPVVGANGDGRPLAEPGLDHVKHAGAFMGETQVEPAEGVFQVMPSARERRGVEEAEQLVELGLVNAIDQAIVAGGVHRKVTASGAGAR